MYFCTKPFPQWSRVRCAHTYVFIPAGGNATCNGGIYTVKSSQQAYHNCDDIARDIGISVDMLKLTNPHINCSNLQPGQELCLRK